MFKIFNPRHRYRPSHWLTAIPLLQEELKELFELSRSQDKGQKLLVLGVLSLLLKKEDYLRQQALKEALDPEFFITLRFSWEERKLLDSLWWGPRRVLTDEDLSQVLAGPGARERMGL